MRERKRKRKGGRDRETETERRERETDRETEIGGTREGGGSRRAPETGFSTNGLLMRTYIYIYIIYISVSDGLLGKGPAPGRLPLIPLTWRPL